LGRKLYGGDKNGGGAGGKVPRLVFRCSGGDTGKFRTLWVGGEEKARPRGKGRQGGRFFVPPVGTVEGREWRGGKPSGPWGAARAIGGVRRGALGAQARAPRGGRANLFPPGGDLRVGSRGGPNLPGAPRNDEQGRGRPDVKAGTGAAPPGNPWGARVFWGREGAPDPGNHGPRTGQGEGATNGRFGGVKGGRSA